VPLQMMYTADLGGKCVYLHVVRRDVHVVRMTMPLIRYTCPSRVHYTQAREREGGRGPVRNMEAPAFLMFYVREPQKSTWGLGYLVNKRAGALRACARSSGAKRRLSPAASHLATRIPPGGSSAPDCQARKLYDAGLALVLPLAVESVKVSKALSRSCLLIIYRVVFRGGYLEAVVAIRAAGRGISTKSPYANREKNGSYSATIQWPHWITTGTGLQWL
jgi:hypothetical protein